MEYELAAKTLFTVHSYHAKFFGHEKNNEFVVQDEEQEYATDQPPNSQHLLSPDDDNGNATPARQMKASSFMRITTDPIHDPIVPKSGFVFGSNEKECDVLLDNDQGRGISRQQFAILQDWDAGTLIFKNLSKQGTYIESRLLGRVRLYGTQTLQDNETVNVELGAFDVQIRVPNRSGHRDVFLRNLSELRIRLLSSLPSLQKLVIESQKTTVRTLRTDYILEQQLGKGSQAVVYRGRHRVSGRVCALKEFSHCNKYNEQEARILSQIKHAHIIQVYFIDVYEGKPVMGMELGGGPDLHEVMYSWPLNGEEARTGLKQLLEAVDYLHSRGITHRDIKPANVIVHRRNPLCLKFTDFGLATNSEDLKTFVGTATYVAPELQYGSHYSNKVDIWSLGIMALDFYYGLPIYPKDGPKNNNPRWRIIIGNHLAAQQPQKVTWSFIHSLLRTDPRRRPSAKESLNHPFFTTPLEPIVLPHELERLTEPTIPFDLPLQEFENADKLSTTRESAFHTALQTPQAQIPSGELSTIRLEAGHSAGAASSPSHHKTASHELSTGRLVVEDPDATILHPTYCEKGSHEVFTTSPATRHSTQNIKSPSYDERVSLALSSRDNHNQSIPDTASYNSIDFPKEECGSMPDTAVYNSSDYSEEESVRLLQHENPLRNPLYVGSYVAKMGREKLLTIPEQEQGSRLPSYDHTAQFRPNRHVAEAVSSPSNLDSDDLTISRWCEPNFPGSNSGRIIGTHRNAGPPTIILNRAIESREYDTEVGAINSIALQPPTTPSPIGRFESTSSVATRDFEEFYAEQHANHSELDCIPENSIGSQDENVSVQFAPTLGRVPEDSINENTTVLFAPTPGRYDNSINENASIQYAYPSMQFAPTPGRLPEDSFNENTSILFARTPGRLEDSIGENISVRFAPTPGREDPDTESVRSSPDGLVLYAVIKQQRVSMRTSDCYLNAAEICFAAGLDPKRSRKHLLPLRNLAIGPSTQEELWVPFSDGISLCKTLRLDHNLEEQLLRTSEPPQEDIQPSIEAENIRPSVEVEDIRPSIEVDDEPLQPVSRIRDDRDRKRKRIGAHDKAILKELFDVNPQPDRATFIDIASRTSLDEDQVADWFRNRQRKLKRNRTG